MILRPKFRRDCCGAARCLSTRGAAAAAVSSSKNSADTVEAAATMAGRLAVWLFVCRGGNHDGGVLFAFVLVAVWQLTVGVGEVAEIANKGTALT